MFVNSVHAQTASYRKRNAPQSTVLQNPPKKVDAYHRALPSNHSVKANKCAVPKDCASRMKCDTACQNYANNIPVLSPRKKLLQNSDSKFDQQRGMQHVHHSMENCFLLSGQWHSRLSAAAVQVNEELASGPKEPAAKVCDHWLIGRSRTKLMCILFRCHRHHFSHRWLTTIEIIIGFAKLTQPTRENTMKIANIAIKINDI